MVQSIDRQLAGVAGRLGHAANFPQQLFPADLPRLFHSHGFHQLRNRRPAGHRWNAAFGTKANVGDALFFQFQREFQDVSAGGVFQLRGGVGSFNHTRVSWVLEMVEEFGRIHRAIVMRRGLIPLPYNRSGRDLHNPRRIACLQPSATVILASVGELERVVACTKYCADVVPEVQSEVRSGKRLIIADSWNSKASEILAARPDLVIAAVPYQEAAVAEILRTGIRFLGLAPRTLKDIYSDIALISGLAGAGERGARVISDMQQAIADVQRQTTGLPRKRVFCEEWGKPVIASQPWVAELVHAAGGNFLGKPGAQCSTEEIARQDPEVIIAAWCGAGDRVPLAKIAAERGWSDITAVRNSQVYCISDELLNTPAPKLFSGLRALAGAIHPAVFGPQPGVRSLV